MARKKQEGQEGQASGGPAEAVDKLTTAVRKQIESLVENTLRLKLDQEALKEDFEAVAQAMGCKATAVRGLVALVIQERNKGGVLEEKERHLDWARQVLDSESDADQA